MSEWTIEEEQDRLAERFKAVGNRAKFAREHKIPGRATMIQQHITKVRPISRNAALAYAKAFGCKLSDISPRLAREASEAVEKDGPVKPERSRSRGESASTKCPFSAAWPGYERLSGGQRKTLSALVKTFIDAEAPPQKKASNGSS